MSFRALAKNLLNRKSPFFEEILRDAQDDTKRGSTEQRPNKSPKGALYTSPGQSEAAPWVPFVPKRVKPCLGVLQVLLEDLGLLHGLRSLPYALQELWKPRIRILFALILQRDVSAVTGAFQNPKYTPVIAGQPSIPVVLDHVRLELHVHGMRCELLHIIVRPPLEIAGVQVDAEPFMPHTFHDTKHILGGFR